jgi:hypothetical protein
MKWTAWHVIRLLLVVAASMAGGMALIWGCGWQVLCAHAGRTQEKRHTCGTRGRAKGLGSWELLEGRLIGVQSMRASPPSGRYVSVEGVKSFRSLGQWTD